MTSFSLVMRPSDMLMEAIKLLQQDGWCRGFLIDSRGRHCGVGALLSVYLHASDPCKGCGIKPNAARLAESYNAVRVALDAEAMERGFSSFMTFNDDNTKRQVTKTTVLLAMRRVHRQLKGLEPV